jgi:glycosyltransferase involved in cell wall biosynthesis
VRSAHFARGLRVCFFGTYDSSYPGNRVLIEGLRRIGVEIVECHIPLWENTPIKGADYYGVWSLVRLGGRFALAMVRLLIQAMRAPACSVVITGFNGYFDLPAAKLVTWFWKGKLVFNPMMSMYDTLVLDRQRFREGTLLARLILWVERALYTLPDALLLDSRVHYQFFAEHLKCPWSKFRPMPFGADDRIFYPRPRPAPNGRFRVLFYGKYQPLQGVVWIVEAARLLQSDPAIDFCLIGTGPTWPEVQQRARDLGVQNIQFVKWVDFHQLPEVIARADVCLGIFGVSDKVDRCIANKVVQALAMRKAVITGYTKAMAEVLMDREQVIFCESGNPKALADAIAELKQNVNLRQQIADLGYDLFRQRFSPEAIGALARRYLEDLIA